MLCLDEDVIYDGSAGRRCPACGSAATFPVSRWVNRPEPTVAPRATVGAGS